MSVRSLRSTCIQQANQFRKVVTSMQEQVVVFYDPKTAGYCTSKIDAMVLKEIM